MGEPAEACPKCNSHSVVFDDIQGLSVCESCGTVLEESELVQHVTWDEGHGPRGVFVSADDSGRATGAYLLPGSGLGLSIQRSSRHQAQAKLKARLLEVANQLQLQRVVATQALHFQEQLLPTVMGNWRRDHIVAAAIYTACRTEQLPLTLMDLSGAMHIDMHTLGRHYRAALKLLNVDPPPLEPDRLLARCLERVAAALREAGKLPQQQPGGGGGSGSGSGTAGSTGGGGGGGSLRQLQPDASLLLRWMSAHLEGSYPLASVGAAVVVAAEMQGVAGVGSEAVAGVLHVGRDTISRKVLQVRRRLLELSRLLPYSANVTAKNVGSHARMLIKLSGVLVAAGGGAATSAEGEQQVQQAALQEAQRGAQQGVQQGQRSDGKEAQAPANQPVPGRQQGEAPKRKAGAGAEEPCPPSKHPRVVGRAGDVGGAEGAALDQQAAGRAVASHEESGEGEAGRGVEAQDLGGDLEDLGEGEFDAELEQYLRRPHEVELMRVVLEERTKQDTMLGDRAKEDQLLGPTGGKHPKQKANCRRRGAGS